MGFTPRKSSAGNFERVTFPLGENVMTLEAIKAFYSEPSEWKPQGQLTFMLVWKDADGDEFTEFPSAPKEFGYNEKATFWNRVAALAGKTGFDESDFDDDGNLATVSLELEGMDAYTEGDPVEFFINTTLKDRNGQFHRDERGKNAKSDMDVLYQGVSVIGRQCRLVMNEKKDKDGKVVEGNKVAQNGALPLTTGAGKKKSGMQAPPPVAAAPAASAMP